MLSILPVLYLYLNHMELSTLTFLAEFLLSQICEGTSKNSLWTELFPRIIQIIVRNGSKYFVAPNNLTFLGYNYRSKIVDQLINSSHTWKRSVIPDIASMLKYVLELLFRYCQSQTLFKLKHFVLGLILN